MYYSNFHKNDLFLMRFFRVKTIILSPKTYQKLFRHHEWNEFNEKHVEPNDPNGLASVITGNVHDNEMVIVGCVCDFSMSFSSTKSFH